MSPGGELRKGGHQIDWTMINLVRGPSERSFFIPQSSRNMLSGKDHLYMDTEKQIPDILKSGMSALRRISGIMCKVVMVLLAVFVLWNLGTIVNTYQQLRHMHITCADNQPLASVQHNFLPADEFRLLSESLPNHPLVSRNSLAEDKFNTTVGWLVKFNRDSLESFRNNPLFQLALPYVDRVLIPEANAFVFNLLVCEETRNKIAVHPHFDNTVGLKLKYKSRIDIYLAHQVNVLYTSIPDGVKGGELDVWPFGNDDVEDGKVVVRPAENLMVAFRGDAYHKVRGFQSPSKDSRISLVFEQYHIPESMYYQTVPYCENRECHTA